MKLLICFLFIFQTTLVLAQPASAPSLSKDDEEVFLAAIKEKEVRDQLVASPQFESCVSQFAGEKDVDTKNEKIRACVVGEISKLDESQLKELDEKLGTGIFKKKKSKPAKSLTEYLGDRLSEALYGVDKAAADKFTKLKDQNLVDHQTFYKLYREQLAKNTMLHVSQYCFENFGFDNSKNIVLGHRKVIDLLKLDSSSPPKYIPDPDKIITGESSGVYTNKNGPIPLYSGISTARKIPDPENPNSKKTVTEIWGSPNKLREFKICSKAKIEDCLTPEEKRTNASSITAYAYKKYRTVEMLEVMKNAEFQMAEATQDKILKDKFHFCTLGVVQNMCEVYQCKNIYNKNTNQEVKQNCEDAYNITVTSIDNKKSVINSTAKKVDTSANLGAGALACSIKDELKNYKLMIATTKDLEEKLKKDGQSFKSQKGYLGFRAGGSVKGIYNTENKQDITTNELTSIGSKELTSEVEEFSKAEGLAKDLKDNCFENGKLKDLSSDPSLQKQCKELMAELDYDNMKNIELDAETQVEVYAKKVADVGNSKDQIEKFIEEEGLKDKIGIDDINKYSPDELKEILVNHFRSEKLTQLDAIKKRFNSQVEEVDVNDSTKVEEKKTAVALEKISDIEEHKRRVANLFQYSNIITSYLQLDNGKGKTSANVVGRKLETTESLEGTESYMEYFGKGVKDSDTTNSSDGYLKLIDSVISGQDKTNPSQ